MSKKGRKGWESHKYYSKCQTVHSGPVLFYFFMGSRFNIYLVQSERRLLTTRIERVRSGPTTEEAALAAAVAAEPARALLSSICLSGQSH